MGETLRTALVPVLVLIALTAAVRSASAQQPLVSPVSGLVEVRVPPSETFAPLVQATGLPGDAVVRTGPGGFALVRYADSTEVVVRPGSEVRIGGEGSDGVRVMLGKVLLRIRRLITPGQERTHRTPTTVAAVRGTEFGLAVEASGRTRVYVFEGAVVVTHAALEGEAVRVEAGRMTDVRVDRRPTEPRPFEPGAFENAGAGEVERGEDRVVEGGQAPVALRWLAFADADLDALANPAYLAGGGAGVSALVFGEAAASRARVDEKPVTDDVALRALGQGLGRATMPEGVEVAAFAQADRGRDRAERAVRAPGEPTSALSREETTWRIGEARLLAALLRGSASFGVSIGHRRAVRDAESTPVGDPTDPFTSEETSDITTVSVGMRRTGLRTWGVSLHHSEVGANTSTTAGHADLAHRRDALEALMRGAWSLGSWAGWLRLGRTAGDEERTALDGAPRYTEATTIHTARVGLGIGIAPLQGLLVGLDVAGGLADERARQSDPFGGVLEDEDDVRLSGSLHAGAQAAMGGPWSLELSVLHTIEHIGRDFPVHGSGSGFTDTRTFYATRALAGLVFRRERWTGRYAIAAPPDSGRPWVHSLVVAFR